MFNASFPTVPGRHGVLVSGEASVQPRTGALHSLARTWLRVSRLNRREKNTEDRRKDVLHAFLFSFFFPVVVFNIRYGECVGHVSFSALIWNVWG